MHFMHFLNCLYIQVVQLLLSSNMCAAMLEPKPSDPNGVSPLHLAAKNGHIDVIRWGNASLFVARRRAVSLTLSVFLLAVAERSLHSPDLTYNGLGFFFHFFAAGC